MSAPLTEVRQISRVAYGFIASKALFAALNLELFGHLAEGAPTYFGDYYRFQIDRQIYPNLVPLDAGLAGDEANMAHVSISDWLSTAAKVELGRARRLLDVAGGSGAYAITFCRAWPELSATIIDFPSVIEVAKRFVAEAGMAERIALVAGNALEAEWPAGQDVALMSYLERRGFVEVHDDVMLPEVTKYIVATRPGP